MLDPRIRLRYFIGSKLYTERLRLHIPRIGDEVRFDGVVYTILQLIWIEDLNEANFHIALTIEKTKI